MGRLCIVEGKYNLEMIVSKEEWKQMKMFEGSFKTLMKIG
jgi:hypothetical protein